MTCHVFSISFISIKFFYPYHLPYKYFLFAILIFQFIVYPRVKHDAQSESYVTNVDDNTNCSTSNTVNLDEEIDLPYDMLEALEDKMKGPSPGIYKPVRRR
jgi:hypothetical protein